MAEKKDRSAISASTEEVKKMQSEFESKKEKQQALFAAAKKAIGLIDLTKNETKTYTVFSKDKLRSYLKNPKANESNLRALSQFLYRLSHPYRRLTHYYAEMLDLNAYTVIPFIAANEEPNEQEVLDRYQNALFQIEKMNLASELQKALVVAWREDAFFGYAYEDDESFYIMPLDGTYCKVSSVNFDGTYNMAFDFSFFRNNPVLLQYWDKEFTKKYNAFTNDSALRWQELDSNRTVVLKVNKEDPTLVLPPFISIFESIIDLVDLQALQSVKEELKNYKLLVNQIPMLKNADDVDEFAVDLDTAVEFYNKLVETLPDLVGACLSPLEITPVDFKDSVSTQEVDIITQSLNNLFSLSGTSQMLFNSNVGGSVGLESSIKCDSLMALSLLRQIEAWTNRYLKYITNDPLTKVRYIDVTPYNRTEKKNELKEAGTLGVPVKLQLAAIMGYTPLQALSMDFLENKVLKLHETWIPLSTSYTQTDNVVGQGAPEKDSSDLTEEGANSRDKK